MAAESKKVSPVLVIIAFATVYLVWGSTYFFIQKAIQHIPAMMLGVWRFLAAGLLMLLWCIYKKEKLWDWQQIKPAVISGVLLLFVGNGAVIWAEKSLPSSLAAVLVSSSPIWFVVLDKPKWRENFSNRNTVLGLIIGFLGVILLFSEQASKALSISGNTAQFIGLVILMIGSMSWAGGSLYSKYKSSGSAIVNTTWQMLAAGVAFIPASIYFNEWSGFRIENVTTDAWLSLFYLIFMGSLAAYSAYVWLLKVRPATQVSTYAYVNPVVAVVLGVLFAGEHMSWIQFAGLAIILTSVVLLNRSKHQKEIKLTAEEETGKSYNKRKPSPTKKEVVIE